MRKKGGSFATLCYRVRKGKIHWKLVFSGALSEQMKNFRSARVTYLPQKIKINFSLDNMAQECKVWREKGRYAIPLDSQSLFEQVFPNFPNSPDFPLRYRKGSVSLRGSEAIVTFPYTYNLLSPSTARPLEVESIIGFCRITANEKGGYAYLVFGSEISRELRRKKIQGARLDIKDGRLILYCEGNCVFSCKKCPRLDCQPIYYAPPPNFQSKISVLGFLKEMGFSLEELAKLPLEQRKGEVFSTPPFSIITIKLPFLRGGN